CVVDPGDRRGVIGALRLGDEELAADQLEGLALEHSEIDQLVAFLPPPAPRGEWGLHATTVRVWRTPRVNVPDGYAPAGARSGGRRAGDGLAQAGGATETDSRRGAARRRRIRSGGRRDGDGFAQAGGATETDSLRRAARRRRIRSGGRRDGDAARARSLD